MKKILVTGKSIEEATQLGLQQLGVTEDRVTIHILEQPSKGFFGLIGSKNAKIEMELNPDPLEPVVSFLEDVFHAMQMDVTIKQKIEEDIITFELSGSEIGIIIGRRGQTLDSLQYLVNIVANRNTKPFLRILLDAEKFRERRKQTLDELADRLAKRVIRTGKEVVLEPMSPLERKIIHSYLQDHLQVRTYSKGDEPNRKVIISLK